MWLWGQIQALVADLPLTSRVSRVTLGKFLKLSSSVSSSRK